MKRAYVLAVLAVLAGIGDAVSTWIAVRHIEGLQYSSDPGHVVEGNPLMASLMASIGVVPTLAITAASGLAHGGIALVAYRYRHQCRPVVRGLVWLFLLVRTAVVANNIAVVRAGMAVLS